MRFKLTAEVEGDLFLQQPHEMVEADVDGLSYELSADESRRVHLAAVSCRISPDKLASFHSRVTRGSGDQPPHVYFVTDPELYNHLVTRLQALESELAFAFFGMPLKRIHWRECWQELVAETDDEQAQIEVNRFRVKGQYPRVSVAIGVKTFRAIVSALPLHAELSVPLAFWREGMNAMSRFEYVQAFYNFYFVIEDFFAAGRTSEKEVLRQYRGSPQCLHILGSTLETFAGGDDRHWQNLTNYFRRLSIDITPIGLGQLLFRVRGSLHHYFGQAGSRHATPFNQQTFDTIALVAMTLTVHALGLRIGEINKAKGIELPEGIGGDITRTIR